MTEAERFAEVDAMADHAHGLQMAAPILLRTLTELCFVIRTGGDVLAACEGAEKQIAKAMGEAS